VIIGVSGGRVGPFDAASAQEVSTLRSREAAGFAGQGSSAQGAEPAASEREAFVS